jgi:ribosomal protein L15E
MHRAAARRRIDRARGERSRRRRGAKPAHPGSTSTRPADSVGRASAGENSAAERLSGLADLEKHLVALATSRSSRSSPT